MNARSFYENYWLQEAPPPASDPTREDRKRLLLKTFSKYNTHTARKRLLDAGCGDGEFLGFLAQQGFDVYGVDISEKAIARARERCSGPSLYCETLEEALPWPSGFFDVIWCTEVLEHLFDIPKVLAGLNRVLKQNGLLILTTPYHGLVKTLGITLLRFEKHFDVTGPHIRFFTKRSIRAELAKAGFESLHWSGLGRIWPLYKSFFVVAIKM